MTKINVIYYEVFPLMAHKFRIQFSAGGDPMWKALETSGGGV